MYLIDADGNIIQERKTVFEAAYSLLSSAYQKNEINYLLKNINDDGWFQFFGKNTEYSEDLDDTVLAWLALLKSNVKKPQESSRIIGEITTYHINSDKLFTTWRKKPKGKDNSADIVVNLNVLRFLHYLGVRNRNAEEAVVEWFRSDAWLKGTNYYHSPIFIKALLFQSLPDFIPSPFSDCLLKNLAQKIHSNWIDFKGIFQKENSKRSGILQSAFRCRTKPIFFSFIN